MWARAVRCFSARNSMFPWQTLAQNFHPNKLKSECSVYTCSNDRSNVNSCSQLLKNQSKWSSDSSTLKAICWKHAGLAFNAVKFFNILARPSVGINHYSSSLLNIRERESINNRISHFSNLYHPTMEKGKDPKKTDSNDDSKKKSDDGQENEKGSFFHTETKFHSKFTPDKTEWTKKIPSKYANTCSNKPPVKSRIYDFLPKRRIFSSKGKPKKPKIEDSPKKED